MIKYSVFTPCKPSTKEQAILAGKGVMFLKDEEGNCWYDVAKQCLEEKLTVVLINDAGTVCGFNADASQMFPNGFSVVATKQVPQMLDNSGMWKFDGSAFVYAREKEIDVANQRKTDALTNVGTLLQMYKDILSKEELNPAALEAVPKLEAYRDLLIAVDVTRAPSIDWPSQPIL